MARNHITTSMLGALLVAGAATTACVEDDEGSMCGKSECAVSCEYVCAQVYGGCDYVFKSTAGRVATFDDCVVACDKGFFTGAERSCLAEVYCGEVDMCFDEEVPDLPAELIAGDDGLPTADPLDDIYPGDDSLDESRHPIDRRDGSLRLLPVGQRRPLADPPDDIIPVPGNGLDRAPAAGGQFALDR
jgi:hypothetical protein